MTIVPPAFMRPTFQIRQFRMFPGFYCQSPIFSVSPWKMKSTFSVFVALRIQIELHLRNAQTLKLL